jgi:16S rRNA (cytosine967-C5)-methyltransferase
LSTAEPLTSWAILALAAKIINRSSRNDPADHVLRTALREHGGLSPYESAEISHSVFSYYRWHGWLNERHPLERQIEQAREWARRRIDQPEGFDARELEAKAIPNWVKAEVPAHPAWLRTLQDEPRLWLRSGPKNSDELAHRFSLECSPHILGAMTLKGNQDLFKSPEFHAGEFEIQDIASQAVGWVCHPEPGQTWWDACAGEGGKTLHLSDLMHNKGLIWATDRSKRRLAVLKRRAGRAGCFNYRTAEWDGSAKLPTKTRFDGILVDAPCTGLGTWARNPHARWTVTPDDLRELAEIQTQLLNNSARNLKEGGRLIYAVCTLTRRETTAVADAFQAAHPDFVPQEFANPFSPKSPKSARQLWWPDETGGNGMFVAVWRRQASNPGPEPTSDSLPLLPKA